MVKPEAAQASGIDGVWRKITGLPQLTVSYLALLGQGL